MADISKIQPFGDSTQYTLQARTDSDGNIITDTYLKRSGGTMTGDITLSSGAEILALNAQQILRMTSSTTDNNSTGCSWYGIGRYNVDEGTADAPAVRQWFNISNYWGINITTRGHTYLRHNGNILLSAGNYNDYAPTKTGGGASGTWGISISGNAATATKATQDSSGNTITSSYLRRFAWWNNGDSHDVNDLRNGCTFAYSGHNAPTTGTIISFDCSTSTSYTLQLMGRYSGEAIYYRNRNGDNGTWNAWRQLVHNSGTWGISITGNAATATKATQDGSGNVITSKYVTLDTDQTITGTKTFRKRIIAYGYNQSNSLPFMTFDKPGSYATGIGPDGTGNRIKFGPCDLAGTAWTAQSSFNTNEWYFQGLLTCTNTLNTSSNGIIANHGHNFMVGGNEVNFIPDSYNSTFWWNYTTFSRNSSGTISNYYFGDGQTHWNTTHIYAGTVHNAVWNDFAEFRESDITEPGRVLVSNGHGKMILCQKRLAPGAKVISDTFGCSVGESDTAKTPLGVAGRVLAYTDVGKNKFKVGDAVCSGPNGTISRMRWYEKILFPDRIIGIVDEIPDYERWIQYHTCEKEGMEAFPNKVADIEINDRIWIYVK